MSHLAGDRHGYSVTWWAAFFTFLMLPLLSMAIGIGRYAIAAAEVQEAADLAALAASRDIIVRLFEDEGYIWFADQVPYRRAEYYANLNTNYLDAQGIRVRVTYMYADNLEQTVTVRCAADVSPLFLQVFPRLVLEREGIAQIRMRAWLPQGGLLP